MEFTWAKGELPAFWGLFDPGWWDRMLDATTSGHYSPEALILTVGIFTLAGVCIALGLLVSVHLRRGETAPSTWVVKPAAVRGLMNMALAQRSKLRVSFVRDDPGARSTDAAILAADPARGIELEMTTLVRANQSWVGKLVACDFRLRPDPRKDYHNFYSFVVPVTRIAKAGDDFIHMTVAWPSRLELEQKRAFLRVEPPRGSILGLDMWHETMVRGTRGSFGDPATWGEALLHWDPRDALSGIEVRNLSGGGAAPGTRVRGDQAPPCPVRAGSPLPHAPGAGRARRRGAAGVLPGPAPAKRLRRSGEPGSQGLRLAVPELRRPVGRPARGPDLEDGRIRRAGRGRLGLPAPPGNLPGPGRRLTPLGRAGVAFGLSGPDYFA